jgi:hypothetical protein
LATSRITSEKTAGLAFYEVQKMNHVWWVMLLVYGLTALCWWGYLQQIIFGEPWGSKPAPDWMMWLIWIVFGFGLPVFFNLLRLEVRVDNNNIAIRYHPLMNREISLLNIEHFEVRQYSALKEYGGWGIRGGSQKKAYNVYGNEGVELTMRDGSNIMIGSQEAEALEASLRNTGTWL